MLRQVTEGLVWGLFLLASNLAHATYVQEGTRLYEPGAYEFGETISTNGDGSMLAMCDNAENVYLYSVTQAGARTLIQTLPQAGQTVAFNLAGNVLLIGTGFSASVCTGAPGSGFYTLSTTLTLVAEGNFGDAVAINDIGDVAVIGAPDTNYGPGAAYVFRKTSGTWDAGTELVGTGKVGDASFGDAVAINGDGGDEQLGVDVGAVFVYKLAGGSYVENQGPILGNYYVDEPQIGRVVALSKDASTLVFSGYNDNNDDGSVWIFGLGASAICPHLTIKTSTWSKKVRAGKDVKVTVRVVNKNKKNETEPLSVSLPLPAGVTYRGRTVLPKNRKLPAANTSVENGVVTWTTSPLARRKSRKFVATLQVDASLPSGSMSVFLATVTNGAVCFVDAAPRNLTSIAAKTPK